VYLYLIFAKLKQSVLVIALYTVEAAFMPLNMSAGLEIFSHLVAD
jgi:hypothetical protein